jgi:outer membrane immunogenic protein
METDWTASARARLGYLTSPDTLFYVSAGVQVAHAVYGYDVFIESSGFDESQEQQDTLYGLVLAAIGAETAVTPRIHLRYEYLMSFLNEQTFSIDDVFDLSVTPLVGTARIAAIVDLGANDAHSGDVFGFVPEDWTGFYVSGVAGHAMADTTLEVDIDEDPFFASGSFDGFGGDGWVGGLRAGYDAQLSPNWVLGVDGGYFWTDVANVATLGPGEVSVGHDSYYNVRGRLGRIVNPTTMIYGVLGWAHANGTIFVTDGVDTFADVGFDRDGVEFGGGIESWVTPHMTLRAEYTRQVFGDDFDGLFPTEFGKLTTTVGNATLAAVWHLG